MQDQQELKILKDSIWVEQEQDKFKIFVSYPLRSPAKNLFPPALSNSKQAKGASEALVKKLEKKNLLEKFHDEMQKSLKQGHIKILSEKEIEQLKDTPVYFPFLNYQTKSSSSTQKLRPINNSSAPHVSGSLNLHLIPGPTVLNNPKTISHHGTTMRLQ